MLLVVADKQKSKKTFLERRRQWHIIESTLIVLVVFRSPGQDVASANPQIRSCRVAEDRARCKKVIGATATKTIGDKFSAVTVQP